MVQHSLTMIDSVERTAMCTACGKAVRIIRAGNWRCAEANLARCREWTKANPGKARKNAKRWRDRHREHYRKQQARYKLGRLYGLTPEDVERLKDEQLKHPVYALLLGKKNVIDHCHRALAVRGILDNHINLAIGLIEKDHPVNTSQILRAMADYIDNPPASILADYAKK